MNIEKPYLVVVFGILLFLGISTLFDHRLKHDFPYAYGASDTFQQQTRVEGIKDAGNYRYEPFYIVKGFKDVIGYYPPVIHHLGIMLHYSSGVPVYDTTYFMVFFVAILAAFVMYVIIGSYNKQIAILSLPFSILIFSSKPYIGFLWGHWASITAQFFLICVFWAFRRIEMQKMGILLGILIGALGLSHTSELLYGALFVAVYCLWILITKKFTLEFFKKIIIAAIISSIITAYSLFIFVNSFMVINPYRFRVSIDWGGTPIFSLIDFGLLLVFLAIGIGVSFFNLKKFDVPALAGFFMILIGHANYIGFGIRAFQPRLLWPVYLSFFFGLGLYMIVKFIPIKSKNILAIGISALFILMLSNVMPVQGVPTYYKISSPGLMDQWHWEAFQWISKNTPQGAKVYFFYGDVYDQDAILRNSKRMHAQIIPEQFVELINNRTIESSYATEFPADHGAGMPYIKSFLKIGVHSREQDGSLVWKSNVNVCQFDYFVFDRVSREKVLADYNLLIANEMVSKGAEVVFQNEVVIILKNNKVGADCIEKRSF